MSIVSVIFLVIYLIGSILSYGCFMGYMWYVENDYVASFRPREPHLVFKIICAFSSWFGVLAAYFSCLTNGYEFQIKWTYRDLIKKYNQSHED